METEIKIKLDLERYKKSLHEFVKDAFVNTGEGMFVDGKHIGIICHALEHLYYGDIKSNSLFVNVPPSHTKSLLVAVMYPLWVWATQDPHTRFMFLSYADNRAMEDSKRRRVLFNSEWYQSHFPIQLTGTGDNVTRLTNVFGGSYFSSGIFGQLTGEHCDVMVLDDVINGDDRFSDIVLDKVAGIYDNILPSRFNDPKKGKKVIICQRLSDKDIIGHIEEKKEPFEKIILPEIFDGERYKSKFKECNDWRKNDGDLLWSERFDSSTISKIQFSMTELDVSGQYQQRPTPLSGHIFRKEWFQNRIENVDVYARYIFADTASSLKGDFTALMCVEHMSNNHIFIREIKRGKWEFPQLIKEITSFAERWKWGLDAVVIEEKSSGIQAIQTLRGTIPFNIVGYQPVGSK